jgi:hypothetical protein
LFSYKVPVENADTIGMVSHSELIVLACLYIGLLGLLLALGRFHSSVLTRFLPLAIGLVAGTAFVYQIFSLFVWFPILGAAAVFVCSPRSVVKSLRQQ